MDKNHIKEIAQFAGGVVALSLALGLSRSAVSQWKQVPLERAKDVARITRLPLYRIRPDFFDAPKKSKAA